MVGVIPVAVSVHTVISWVFAMTIQPMWHSTIFGPYFVAGAIFSGIAAILSFLIILRKVYKLEDYLKPVHLDYLGKLLLVMTMFWLYFTFSEYLTTYYGNEPQEMAVFNAKLFGPYAPQFWTMAVTCFCIPFLILCRRATRSSPVWLFVASISVNIGMYLERYTIVVPTLINPRVPITQAIYHPSWVEWGVLAGTISTFLLLYLTFIKIFPIISVWEVEEGIHEGIDETRDRVASYFPAPESAPPHRKGGAA